MLKITRQQMDGFRESHARSFEERMVAHLGERFPLRAAAIGPAELRRVIERGLGSAALHGLSREDDVRRLIELMCALADGGAAPDDEWMNDVLDHATPENISARLEQLGAAASERLTRPDAAAPDPLRQEAAAALAAGEGRPLAARTGADEPVTPCPAGKKKRLCSFSS
jgi:hypothetical protein